MSTSAEHLAHHFDDAEQQYDAATLGMWVFLSTEILFFGGLFAGYTLYRTWYPQAFAVGCHRLDMALGAINTAVLLSSSLTMALAVRGAQTGDNRVIARFLALTILLGSVFLGIKAFEYHEKFVEHLVPGRSFSLEQAVHRLPNAALKSTNTSEPEGNVELFFSYYFAMTGLHALHMIIGIVILSVLWIAACRGAFSREYFTPMEMTGLYWHFVDIVWVFLFPLLYLIR